MAPDANNACLELEMYTKHIHNATLRAYAPSTLRWKRICARGASLAWTAACAPWTWRPWRRPPTARNGAFWHRSTSPRSTAALQSNWRGNI